MLTIKNLTETTELESTEAQDVKGGMAPLLPSYYAQVTNVTNIFTQNGVNLGISAGEAGIISLAGGISAMPVSAGSAMTFVYSPALPTLAV